MQVHVRVCRQGVLGREGVARCAGSRSNGGEEGRGGGSEDEGDERVELRWRCGGLIASAGGHWRQEQSLLECRRGLNGISEDRVDAFREEQVARWELEQYSCDYFR